MRVLLIIMANVLVLVVSVMAVHEYFNLKRYNSFTVPFTDKMVKLGVIDKNRRDPILKEIRIGHYVGILLSVIVWLMLAKFMAGVSAIPVFIVSALVQIIFLKPDMQECAATRNQYFSSHKKDMDVIKYHAYLSSIENS